MINLREGFEPSQEIQQQRRELNFQKVDLLFKLIDDAGRSVAVPYGEEAELIKEIRHKNHMTSEDRRKLQRFSVGLMPNWVEHFRRHNQIQPVFPGQEDGPLCYVGSEYDVKAIGLRIGELPPETYCQ